MFEITPETTKDSPHIEALLDQVFGANRHDKASYAFRRTVAPVAGLGFVARDHEKLVGTLRFWPVLIGSSPALLLGPIGVAPDRQGNGIGRALISHGHLIGQSLGHRIVLLVGDADYYCRFGYFAADQYGITMPQEATKRVLVHELIAGSLQGVSGVLLAVDGA